MSSSPCRPSWSREPAAVVGDPGHVRRRRIGVLDPGQLSCSVVAVARDNPVPEALHRPRGVRCLSNRHHRRCARSSSLTNIGASSGSTARSSRSGHTSGPTDARPNAPERLRDRYTIQPSPLAHRDRRSTSMAPTSRGNTTSGGSACPYRLRGHPHRSDRQSEASASPAASRSRRSSRRALVGGE